MENPHSILKKVFGYDSFRPGQEEIVSRLLAGQDVLAVMPTAGQPDEGSGGGTGAGRCGGGVSEQQPER